MMQAGNMGGGEREGGKKPSGREKLQLSVCDVSTDDFKKTWLTLKELHDKELHRLQAKLTSLRKERLVDGRRMGSIAKVKELTEQQKVLTDTINELRDKLRSKICDQCSVNETYKNTLQKEFYDIQQRNLTFIAEITAERNKLREENKMLSEKLKLKQQQFHLFSDSDDDLIPCTQKTMPIFTVRDPVLGDQMYMPRKLIRQSNTEQMKSREEKEQSQSSKFPISFHSQDLSDMPQTSFEKISSNSSKPIIGSISNLKSPASFPLIPTQSPPREHEFQVASNLTEDKHGQPERKQIFTQKTSTQNTYSQKYRTQRDFSWSLSSISTGENPAVKVVSETSEENTPDYNKSPFLSFTQRKETNPLNVFPLDYTLSAKRRSMGISRYNIGFSASGSNQASNEQLTLKKNTNESTDAANKSRGDTQSSTVGCGIKRKARMQSEKRRK